MRLGATHWEVIRIAVLSYARRGLFGAAVLGLGRALGETMAVTMVIGNRPEISASLFAPGYTLASVIANEFTEATSDLYLNALFELGPGAACDHDPGQCHRPAHAPLHGGRGRGQGRTDAMDAAVAHPARARPSRRWRRWNSRADDRRSWG